MGGFKDIVINEKIASNILKDIMVKTLACCQLMIQDCKARGEKINNLEEDIRDYLYCNYLNNDEIIENVGLSEFRFYPEVPENYKNSKPKGRIDLQVFSIAMFNCRNMYFTIECKRINGSKKLNRFYLEKGVERFVGKSPLYPSYFKMNCMFG
jgi:hypothetical protein